MNSAYALIITIPMANYFVPFCGDRLATVSINGHNLVIVSSRRDTFQHQLELMGADRVRVLRGGASPVEEQVFLNKIAADVGGGVVVAPSDIPLKDLLTNLERQLPWIH